MNGQQPAPRRNGGRLLAHVAVVIGIVAVAAAAFALSYRAVRDIALAAGVPATLARLYPAIFDAVFVVACAAAVTLREARWWARGYAWLSVLVTGALIGAAAAYHAMGFQLPHKVAAGIVAALPLALAVLGFSLWLSMLRHGRAGRSAAGPDRLALTPAAPGQTLAIEAGRTVAAEPASALPALPAPSVSLPPATENAAPAEPASSAAPADTPEPALGSELAPASEGAPEPQPKPEPEPSPATEPESHEEPAATAKPDSGAAEEARGPEAAPAKDEPAPDALTPPYGFAAVGPATFLSAPVAEPAARGKPPATGTDLPAELAHETVPVSSGPARGARGTGAGGPEDDAAERGTKPETAGTAEEPAATPPPVRFERVRSTPTPPRNV
jgi:Protein of unknown function (DUF2637)